MKDIQKSRMVPWGVLGLATAAIGGFSSPAWAQCGPACNKTNIECLSGQTEATALSVGRVTTPGGGCCTGWVIAGPDLILTNRHCITTNGNANGPVGNVQNMNIIMNFECNTCAGSGGTKPTTTFNVTSLIHSNIALDYAILRVNGNIAANWGVLPLDATVPFFGMPVYEHHHASCQVKGFDNGIVTGGVGSNQCLSGTSHEFPVSIIASQGASGSPIFNSANHAVVGICHCGPACSAGWGVPMSAILPNAIDHIINAGGTPNIVAGFGCPGGGSCYEANGTPGCNNSSCCNIVCAADPFCCNNTWDNLCAGQAFDLCGNCGSSSAGSCYEANGTPGCNNEACCEAVCVGDPFCCNTSWDGLCADDALTTCGNCGGGSAGSCFQANGTPGCNNEDCCSQVCVDDPFCCNTQWDTLCANSAAITCGNCGNSGAGSCYEANGSPGCSNSSCCQTVCASDPFCCATSWDGLCANAAFDLCGNCGDGGAGSCYVSNGSPGCNNEACCEAVCVNDPFCCNSQWDGLCAGDAFEICGNCGDPSAGSCYSANGTVGCNDAECCELVCADDPFCCNTEWDGLCAGAATESCDNCGNPAAGSCYEANGTPGCSNAACCEAVCSDDPFCCNTSWDGICANSAFETCGNCGDPSAGSCYSANGTPGCNNAECCELVCIDDPFCCNISWDGACASGAADLCNNCGNPAAGSCYMSNGTPGCTNASCCEAVCASDPFCCNTSWDGICANSAFTTCGNCGNPSAGSCFSSNGTPGCNDAECCATVCAADPFCCNTSWDGACAGAANNNCDQGSCLGDLDNNGSVGVSDLLILLGAWGPNPGHPADFDGNNTVGVSDLLILLANWGPCP